MFVFFNRTPTVFELVSKKNMFLPFHEQFLTFFEVRLHFLKVGLFGGGLGAVEGLRNFKIELALVFVGFSFKLAWFLKLFSTQESFACHDTGICHTENIEIALQSKANVLIGDKTLVRSKLNEKRLKGLYPHN